MSRKKNEQIISLRIPDSLLEEIDVTVETSKYMNNSDFIRAAIRKEIKRIAGE